MAATCKLEDFSLFALGYCQCCLWTQKQDKLNFFFFFLVSLRERGWEGLWMPISLALCLVLAVHLLGEQHDLENWAFFWVLLNGPHKVDLELSYQIAQSLLKDETAYDLAEVLPAYFLSSSIVTQLWPANSSSWQVASWILGCRESQSSFDML